jgi:hypothetical protein
LRGVDFFQQLTDIFFTSTQATHDSQTHGCRHHTKDFSGTVEGGVVFLKGVKLNDLGFAGSHELKYSLKTISL